METNDSTIPFADTRVDEYLWPLTGDESAVDWETLAEELRLRNRLAEILAHVHERHVQPRVRRLAPGAYAAAVTRALTATVIVGPEAGPPWEQTLADPVPRALRDEWKKLAEALRGMNVSRSGSPLPDRGEGAIPVLGGAGAGQAGHAGFFAR